MGRLHLNHGLDPTNLGPKHVKHSICGYIAPTMRLSSSLALTTLGTITVLRVT